MDVCMQVCMYVYMIVQLLFEVWSPFRPIYNFDQGMKKDVAFQTNIYNVICLHFRGGTCDIIIYLVYNGVFKLNINNILINLHKL